MKNPFLPLLVITVLVLGLQPTPARADPTYECSGGCYVVVCSGDTCSVWRCDSAGCRLMSTWPKPIEQRASSSPRTDPDRGEVAYAKVCADNRPCSLYELDAHQAILLGSFDNIEDIVSYRRRLLLPEKK